jgi:hypothetical protein
VLTVLTPLRACSALGARLQKLDLRDNRISSLDELQALSGCKV